jgi:hypothetical protein
MASGRNINSPENYVLEQYSLEKHREYLTNPTFATNQTTMFPGNGLLTGRYANSLLSGNSTDIESFLYGIGANNLVEPKAPIVANIKKLDQLSLFETQPIILPKTWTLVPNQRLRLLE